MSWPFNFLSSADVEHRLQHTKPSALLDSELPSPFSSSGFVSCTVGLVDVSDFGNKRVVGVGICEHRADGQKDWRG